MTIRVFAGLPLHKSGFQMLGFSRSAPSNPISSATPVACLAKGSRSMYMYRSDKLSGRKERRLPIAVVVCLAASEQVSGEVHERTYTDNISPHGVRLLSARPWQPGQHAEIIPENDEPAMRGEVVYCHRLDNVRFYVGVRFPHGRIPWSTLQRYDGSMNQQGRGRAEGIEGSWNESGR